jgi:hypothetical protein
MTNLNNITIVRTPGESCNGHREGAITDFYVDGKIVATIEQTTTTTGIMYSTKTFTDSYKVDFFNDADTANDTTLMVRDFKSAQSTLAAAKKLVLSIIS